MHKEGIMVLRQQNRTFMCFLFVWSSCIIQCRYSSGQSPQPCDGTCEVGYLTQPVRELTCDPDFDDLQLSCSVYGPPDAAVEILWFRVLATENSTAEPELLTGDTLGINIHTPLLHGDSPSIDSVLEIRNVQPEDAGVYWCQVSINGSYEGLRPSQQLLLRTLEEYAMFPPCPRYIYVTETLCAEDFSNATMENLDVGNTNTENLTRSDLLAEVGDCSYLYLAQPPKSLPCDPYRPEFNDLQLECNVFRPPGVTYEIQWFKQQGTVPDNSTTLTQLTDDLHGIQVNNRTYASGITRSRLIVFDITEEDVGLYWCQIVVFENMSGSITTNKLQPSVFTVLDKSEVYNNCAVCPDVYLFSVGLECADINAVVATNTTSSPESNSIPIPSPSPMLSEPTTEISNHSGNPLWMYIAIPIGGLVVVILVTGAILLAARKFHLRSKQKHTRDSAKVPGQGPDYAYAISYPHPIYTSQPGGYDSPNIYASVSSGEYPEQPHNGFDLEYARGYIVPDGTESTPQRNHQSTVTSRYQSLSTGTQDYMSVYMKAAGSESSLNSFGKSSTQNLVTQYTLPDPSRMDPDSTYTIPSY